MYCEACDRMEWSDLGIDTGTCMKCGGALCGLDDDDDDDDDGQPDEMQEWRDYDPDC